MKKILVCLLSLCFVFQLFSCGNNNNSSAEVELWSAPSSVKILRDKEYSSADKKPLQYKIDAVRGEYESYQIILTANKSVDYDITINDLTLDDGAIFSKDNIKVYNQKYIETYMATLNIDTELGFWPDALIPLDKAKKFGENKVIINKSTQENKLNNKGNQGLWITTLVPREQKAGLYKGNFSLQVDGKNYTIPAEINVFDYTLSPKVTARTVFPIERNSLIYGEYDNSLEMFKKYVDGMLDFRLSSYMLPFEYGNLESFIASAKEYAVKDNVSSFGIPVYTVYDGAAQDISIDFNSLYNHIYALARESIVTNTDLVSKSYIYIGIIDEPELIGIVDRAKRVTKGVEETRLKVCEDLQKDATLVGANYGDIINKVKNIENIVTNKYNKGLDEYVSTWCPKFDDLDSSIRREDYEESGDNKWWYGCIDPKNPYPSYHIDDPSLLSSRIVSWMQRDYNVDGNLYWEIALYQKAIYNEKTGQFTRVPCDPYKEARRFPGVNGDGFLIYPGKPYDVDGFISSIRLHSIRDGMEEYEIIKDIQENNQKSADNKNNADEVLDLLFSELYNGTKVTANAEKFDFARKQLYQLAQAKNNGIYVTNIHNSGSKLSVELAIKNGGKIKVNNSELKEESSSGEVKFYSYKTDSNDKKEVNIEANGAKKTCQINLYAGGENKNIINVQSNEQLVGFSVNKESKISLAKAPESEENALKCEFRASDKNSQTLRFSSSLLESVDKNTFSIEFDVYSESQEKFVLSVYLGGSSSSITSPIGAVYIKEGWNRVKLSHIDKLNWQKIGKGSSIQFTFGQKGDAAKTIYLDNINISKVR